MAAIISRCSSRCRIVNREGLALLDGLRAVAQEHKGTFRLTPNQNVVIADIPARGKAAIAAVLKRMASTGATTRAFCA